MQMNRREFLVAAACVSAIGTGLTGCATAPKTDWAGKRIAVFGDSITDPSIDWWKHWWKWVGEELDADMRVYGANGRQWNDMIRQIDTMQADVSGDVDAVLVFLGTNDYNHNVPLGEWWTVTDEKVNRNGLLVPVKRRLPTFDSKTVRGRINLALNRLKTDYPDRQIVLMTPIRRGYFTCAPTNVQPTEGCRRLALTVAARLRTLPPTFRK